MFRYYWHFSRLGVIKVVRNEDRCHDVININSIYRVPIIRGLRSGGDVCFDSRDEIDEVVGVDFNLKTTLTG